MDTLPDDLALAATYPFLPEARRLVRESAVPVEDLVRDVAYDRVRARALAKVEEALESGVLPKMARGDALDLELELLSHPLARMVVAAVGEEYLIRRYAVAESKRASAALEKDPAEVLERCLAAFGIDVAREEGGVGAEASGTAGRTLGPAGETGWSLHFAGYLAAAPNEKEWKLIRRPVARGLVHLSHDEAARLVEERYKKALGDELAGKRKAVPGVVREGLKPRIEALQRLVAEKRKEFEDLDTMGFDEALFPPCMKRILGDMTAHVNVPHMGRFAIVTFLHRLGMDSEAILKFFTRVPDFNVEKSRYQIEHITGKSSGTEYTTPGCSTMQSFGVCPLEERDGLCHAVKSPLSYYRVKWRDAKREGGNAQRAMEKLRQVKAATGGKRAAPDASGTGARRPRGAEAATGARGESATREGRP